MGSDLTYILLLSFIIYLIYSQVILLIVKINYLKKQSSNRFHLVCIIIIINIMRETIQPQQQNSQNQQQKRLRQSDDKINKQSNKTSWRFLKLVLSFILPSISFIIALYVTDMGNYVRQYISCNSIQCQTVKYMNTTLIYKLRTPKFYKDSVYHTIRNQVKINKQSQKILIVTGKRSIGKSTSIKEIANQLMSNGTPVFFLSLQASQATVSNTFKNKILNNEMFNLLKQWRLIQSYSRYADRFNQLFNYTFPNQIPVLIIDEINTVSQLCQQQCPQIVQLFFKSLIFLRKRGASVILLSSDPNFLYLQKISGVRKQLTFDIIQAQVKSKQDFNEMFKQYKIQGTKKKQILKYFGQRGPIITLFKDIKVKYGKINLKNIKKYITSQLNQCNSIQCQTVKYMNTTLINQLRTPKFYKDSVYHTIRNQVKINKQSQKILIVTGKRSIGKSTSIKEIANQLMSNGTPVFFISLQASQATVSNTFKNKILNNEMFNLLKQWRLIQSYSRQADRFNQLFNYRFPNQIPVLIIDEINTVSQLCQQQCPQIVQLFFKSLIFLRKRGASVILLSSDPNFLYLQKISGVRTMQDFKIIQAHVKPKQDFNEMFKQYKIQGTKKKQILKYYGQREPIIILFKVINAEYGKINLKNIKKYITSQLNQITQQLYAIQAFQKQEKNKKIMQTLMKICIQQQFSINYFYRKYLQKSNVVFNNQFKSKIMMRAFEISVKKQINQTVKCKDAKKYQ